MGTSFVSDRAYNQWFHGYANDKPNQVMSITPGQNLNIEIACSKSYSTFGNSPNRDGCPADSGSFHAGGGTGSGAGWSGNSDSNLMGCALAIAPKSRASDVRPEDFVVMSVQENCVRQRDTPFAIPANLPSCPDGECTCAWFWQGKNSAAEMYMIGFVSVFTTLQLTNSAAKLKTASRQPGLPPQSLSAERSRVLPSPCTGRTIAQTWTTPQATTTDPRTTPNSVGPTVLRLRPSARAAAAAVTLPTVEPLVPLAPLVTATPPQPLDRLHLHLRNGRTTSRAPRPGVATVPPPAAKLPPPPRVAAAAPLSGMSIWPNPMSP